MGEKINKINSGAQKGDLHPRNPHRGQYDFRELTDSCPELAAFVVLNKFNNESIDFANPLAVKTLNKAILKRYYQIINWDIPSDYLCPAIPGRADYLHYLADLLADSNGGEIPRGKKVVGLDIGVGANCVYPIIGNRTYGWQFIGSDIDKLAIKSARNIIEWNPVLKGQVRCREQKASSRVLSGVLWDGEFVDFTMCNPPFHASAEEASAGTIRKLSNLNGRKPQNVVLNFGGQANELWCEGGEEGFIRSMVFESEKFASNCLWFTTLVSKKESLSGIYKILAKVKAVDVKTIEMKQGQKISRMVAWTFLPPEQHRQWGNGRWGTRV